ncbi:MAG: hypothetical protein ACJA1A_003495 [Saprospiraceae bacterium]|jgi:hypothetical protein
MLETKKNMGVKKALPFKLWLAVFSIALLTVIGISNLSIFEPTEFQTPQDIFASIFKTKLANLSKKQSDRTDEYRVLIFGSSLTENAIFQDQYFQDRFQVEGKNIQVNTLFYAAAYYDMLNNPELLEYILTTKPDLLCIEDQVFLFEPKEELIKTQTLTSKLHYNYISNINILKHKIFPKFFPNPSVHDNSGDSTITFATPHPRAEIIISHEDSTNYKPIRRITRKYGKTTQFNKVLTTLNQSGTDLVILNIPRPRLIEKDLLSKKQMRKKERLINQYKEKINVEYWQFDQPLPFKYYWDIAHLNGSGQEIYSNWLFERIDKQ